MKSKVNLLKSILIERDVPKHCQNSLLAYLAVCLLSCKIKDVSEHYKVSEKKIITALCLYGRKLKMNDHFKVLMYQVTQDYLTITNHKIVA